MSEVTRRHGERLFGLEQLRGRSAEVQREVMGERRLSRERGEQHGDADEHLPHGFDWDSHGLGRFTVSGTRSVSARLAKDVEGVYGPRKLFLWIVADNKEIRE